MMEEAKKAQALSIEDDANALFDRLRAICDREEKKGTGELDVLAGLHEAGLMVTDGLLDELGIPMKLRIEQSAWQDWFPWRALYSYYWSQRDPSALASRAFAPATEKADDWDDGDEMLIMP